MPNFVKVKYLNQARAHDLPPALGPGRGEEPEGGDQQEPFTPRPCISAPSPSFTKMVESAVDLLLLKLLHLIFKINCENEHIDISLFCTNDLCCFEE